MRCRYILFALVCIVGQSGRSISVKSVATNVIVSGPNNGTLTTIKISNLEAISKSRIPFTFALPFKSGEVPANTSLSLSPSLDIQIDKKATFSDGSLKHAVVSGFVDLAAGETKIFSVKTATLNSKTPVSLVNLLNSGFDAGIIIDIGGSQYSLSARTLLQSGTPQAWLSGPIVSEWIVGGSLMAGTTAHPSLAGYFHVRSYSDLTVRVDFVVENGWYKVANSKQTYNATLKLNGQVVYTGNNLIHYAEARWHKLAFSKDPKIYVQLDKDYLQNTKAVPRYLPVAPSSANSLQYSAPLSGGIYGAYTGTNIDMADGGDSPWIGPLPKWDSFFINSTDFKSFNYMIAGNDSQGIFGCSGRYISSGAGIHVRDKITGGIVSVDLHPNASAGDPTQDNIPDCIGGNPYLKDSSHQPLVGYTPYLVTGDYYHLEEMAFWNAYNIFEASPGSHGHSLGLFYDGQVRGVAWGYRSLGYAAYIFPDQHPLKTYFTEKLKNNISNDIDKMNRKGNVLGAWFGGSGDQFDNYPIFMDHFFTFAMGLLVDLGYTEARPLLAYKSKFVIGLMGGSNGNSNGFCFQAGPQYRIQVGPTALATFTTWGEVYSKATSCTQACKTTALSACLGLGSTDPYAMLGSQSSPNTSNPQSVYYAQTQPALSMAVQFGFGTLGDHWSLFRSAKNLPDYNVDPRFAILPRNAP